MPDIPNTTQEFPAGTRVRLIGDPGRVGTSTGRTQPGHPGRGPRFKITFDDSTTQWIHGDQLEPVPEQETPVDALRKAKFARACDLRRTLTHSRLTGKLADVIYSMEATNTEFYAYQFKPVLRFLESPSNALLIADEVGLGKTIEAGLIWTELRARNNATRLLVLCPAMLREKWKRELGTRFGVRADEVNAHDLASRLNDAYSRMYGFALIASIEGIRRRDPNYDPLLKTVQREIDDGNHMFDLLVIDEAHYLRNPKTNSHHIGRLLRKVAEHMVLLSATPIHTRNRDLLSLLQMLDEVTFERESDLHQILEASAPLVKARDRILRGNATVDDVLVDLQAALSHQLLHDNRQLESVRQELSPGALQNGRDRALLARRLELVNPMAYVISRTRKRDVHEWQVVRQPHSHAVPMTVAERAFYDRITDIVIRYAMRCDASERFILATPQRQMSSSMAATLRAWQHRRENIDDSLAAGEDPSDDLTKIGPLLQELLAAAPNLGPLDQLFEHDSKFDVFGSLLNEHLCEHPEEKVVVFSTYRATLDYLHERLSADGVESIVMHGGINRSKDEVIAEFREDPEIRVLLSSEVGSEGIDLQFCRVLINYDLPWNPMRIEQRIGRLDRLGQRADSISIINFMYADTIDDRIYRRLYERLDLITQALGDFEAVLGEQVQQLAADLLADHLTAAQQEDRIKQTAQAIENTKHEEQALENEASHLVAYGDFILQEVEAAREMQRTIQGVDLRDYVIDHLNAHYPDCHLRRPGESPTRYEIRLSPAARQDLDDYIRAARLNLPTLLTRDANRPLICEFSNRIGGVDSHQNIETINQFHPLIRLIRAQIDASDHQRTPAVALDLGTEDAGDLPLLPGAYLIATLRCTVGGLRSFERLMHAGACYVDDGWQQIDDRDAERLVHLAGSHGRPWYNPELTIDCAAASDAADLLLFATLHDRADAWVRDVWDQNEDRADLQLRNLERHRISRKQKLQETREKHRMRGDDTMVRLTDGRIRHEMERLDRRQHQIESNRKTTYSTMEILVTLVRILG